MRGLMKVTLTCGLCPNGKMVFEINPGHAPRPCQDPDHPAYSDPGDCPEVIEAEPCDTCGREPTDEDMEAALSADGDDDDRTEEPDERETWWD